MAWCFVDEATPFTNGLLDQLRNTNAVVPAVWPLEVANVLLVAERNQRIAAPQGVRFVRPLRDLPIAVDVAGLARAWGASLALARRYDLTVYDASYLEVAIRRSQPLAKNDARLRGAAGRAGVALVT